MKKEHGTIQAYVIGFILSIVCTLIPYSLAVTHTVTGKVLLGTIIAFALVQALIQLLFFLHLGRERKPKWQTGFLMATAGGILVVTVGTFWIMYHLNNNLMPTQQEMQAVEGEGIAQIDGVQTCSGATHTTQHMIMIMNGVATPAHTNAKMCDSIMFMNDNVSRSVVFGTPADPETYGGQQSLSLGKGQNQILILNEPGTHSFYDQTHSGMTGDFTVSQ